MLESFTNIFKLEVRVCFENLGLRHPFADHPNDGSNRNAQSPNARNSSHLMGLHGDLIELLHLSIPCPGAIQIFRSFTNPI
jgi:hypothetical protein